MASMVDAYHLLDSTYCDVVDGKLETPVMQLRGAISEDGWYDSCESDRGRNESSRKSSLASGSGIDGSEYNVGDEG